MLIGEVTKKTEATKKALYYYEEQGLIHPEIQENGYRYFTDEDIFRIKKVMMLRSIGVSIADIKLYFADVTKEKELLEHYAALLHEERDEVEEKIKMCERLIENDLREYVEMKKVNGSYRKVTYPYMMGIKNEKREKIFELIIFGIILWLVYIFTRAIPGVPRQVPYIIVSILLLALFLIITTSKETVFTEEGMYYYKTNITPLKESLISVKSIFSKEKKDPRLFISYEDMIDAEIRWVKEPMVRRWSVPKVWVMIHTKNFGIIPINPFFMKGRVDKYQYLFEVLTILSEHDIPIFDTYRIVAALEQGKNLSEYIEYLSLDNGAVEFEKK